MSAAEDENPMEAPAPPTEAIESSDESDDNSTSESEPAAEWLATTRAKRSTAGNRMRSMLAAEEAANEADAGDDDLELLFAEDDNDAGFSDADAAQDGSDANMDSSSESENEGGADDDELAGEKELEKQARDQRRAVIKKRKAARDAVPAKFRKKVRINEPPQSDVATATTMRPPPRPKKKSERSSWLPTEAEMPTRASSRETTKIRKQELHVRLVEGEARSKKQQAIMEAKAKRDAENKKPPLTQAERLIEAARVEKHNARSLNRWEEAEKQREEERREKLAALHSRTMEGPVITFYSGAVDLADTKLRHIGRIVEMEDKPARKKRQSAIDLLAQAEGSTATETPSPIERRGSTPMISIEHLDTKPLQGSHLAQSRTSQPTASASFLAPPAGMSQSITAAPMSSAERSSCLAAPNTSHTPPPPAAISNVPAPPPQHTSAAFQPILAAAPAAPQPSLTLTIPLAPASRTSKSSTSPTELSHDHDTEQPLEGKVTRSCIVLRNFERSDLVRRSDVQTQILFGHKMDKLSKRPPPPSCAITGQMGHYRDPQTGLVYRDAAAFRELRKLSEGEYKFSALAGVWAGSGTMAARGVPDRFLEGTRQQMAT